MELLQSNSKNDLLFWNNMSRVEILFMDMARCNLQVFSQVNATDASATIAQRHLPSFA